MVAASPVVILPHASAVVTAFIARDTFCGDGSSISPLPTAASDGSEKRDQAFLARRQHPFETQLHRLRAPPRRLCASTPGLHIEQSRRGERRLVSGAPPPARGIG